MRLDSNGTEFLFYCYPSEKEGIKSIDGSRFLKGSSAWHLPLSKKILYQVVNKYPNVHITDRVHEDLNQIDSYIKEATKIKSIVFNNIIESFRNFLNYPFYNHQLKSFNLWAQLDWAIDFSEPGIGKTMVQIALLKYRILSEDTTKILIVAPLNICYDVWLPEIKKFAYNENFYFPIYTCYDSVSQAKEYLKAKSDGIYLINYEKIWRVEKEIRKNKWDFIILDESSKIKSNGSKQSRAAIRISKGVKFKSILTGTPAPNSLLELFPQLKFISSKIIGDSYTSFKNQYFVAAESGYGHVPKDGTRDAIKEVIDPFMVSWKKKEQLDLPPLTVQKLHCELSKEQMSAYKEMCEEMVTFFRENRYEAGIALTKIMRLAQISSGFIQNTGGDNFIEFDNVPKLQLLKDTVELIPNNRKILIWSIYKEVTWRIERELKKIYGSNSSVIYNGTINTSQKIENKDRFLNDKNCRFFIAHPKTAGMGLNLTVANYSIYYTMSHSFEDYAQSKERYNRTGQVLNMTEWHLLNKKTIDSAIFNSVMNKKKVNDFITEMKEILHV